jgi:hypothetical protein
VDVRGANFLDGLAPPCCLFSLRPHAKPVKTYTIDKAYLTRPSHSSSTASSQRSSEGGASSTTACSASRASRPSKRLKTVWYRHLRTTHQILGLASNTILAQFAQYKLAQPEDVTVPPPRSPTILGLELLEGYHCKVYTTDPIFYTSFSANF